MANGFKVFSTGEVLTAADVNDYLMEQSIGIFANSTARDAQITSPIEGQFCYLADSNVLQFYNGSSWASFIGEGDITGVTVTTAGTSGLSGGATATSGAFSSTLAIAPNSATSATVAGSDIVLIGDADDSNALKKTTAQDIANLSSAGLTGYDAWYLSANVTSDADITANLSRQSGTLVTKIGTGMSESSGIFTFPSTGMWKVSANIYGVNVAADVVLCFIVASDDNFSSEANVALAKFGSGASSSPTGGIGYAEVLLDIEDVSTDKVKFKAVSIASGSYIGGGTYPDASTFTFVRMGDT